MATIKSYSDLQQAKKLAEILPLESADMCWILVNYGDEAGSRYEPSLITYKTGSHFRDRIFLKDHTIPCWSLTALLGVLPKGTNISTPKPINALGYCCWNQYDEIYADNPVDACYEMIIRFNELKML